MTPPSEPQRLALLQRLCARMTFACTCEPAQGPGHSGVSGVSSDSSSAGTGDAVSLGTVCAGDGGRHPGGTSVYPAGAPAAVLGGEGGHAVCPCRSDLLRWLALVSAGYVAADLTALCREALVLGVEPCSSGLARHHFEAALSLVKPAHAMDVSGAQVRGSWGVGVGVGEGK
jgi:hypothetical protein